MYISCHIDTKWNTLTKEQRIFNEALHSMYHGNIRNKKEKKDYLQSFKNYSYSEILAQDVSISSQPGNYHYIPTEYRILGTIQS